MRSNSSLRFYGIKGPCQGENLEKIWKGCPPEMTDILIFNVGFLHCTEVAFASPSDMERGKLNASAVRELVERFAVNLRKQYPRSRLVLHGQPAPELVYVKKPQTFMRRKPFSENLRRSNDHAMSNVMDIESSVADAHGIEYLPSYPLTRHPLKERERTSKGRAYSLGRTDSVHFCLPGLPDFVVDAWLSELCALRDPLSFDDQPRTEELEDRSSYKTGRKSALPSRADPRPPPRRPRRSTRHTYRG
ncbi:hypothetical protein CYMTET_22360 [Cymbomonas tetramitiformis]|uniref:Uncharacterized protein n=1 Tax=Cymbomonas tetramitiformis TaxID=36881 RepID=A0AAE0G1F9_9CHLO|nr:hypothetical protein CYMTET_22360 [Cymbomonas tetramitiformis]